MYVVYSNSCIEIHPQGVMLKIRRQSIPMVVREDSDVRGMMFQSRRGDRQTEKDPTQSEVINCLG